MSKKELSRQFELVNQQMNEFKELLDKSKTSTIPSSRSNFLPTTKTNNQSLRLSQNTSLNNTPYRSTIATYRTNTSNYNGRTPNASNAFSPANRLSPNFVQTRSALNNKTFTEKLRE